MASSFDFLKTPTEKRLRKEIRNICDSYSHSWDILAELSQNAVDALTLKAKQFGAVAGEGKIEITISRGDRSIRIIDSGIGFDPDKVIDFVAPHETDKDEADASVIGQKGVGLTYVIFSSNLFELKSKSTKGFFYGRITNALSWKNGQTNELPTLEIMQRDGAANPPDESFTEIFISGVEENGAGEAEDIFFQEPQILEFLFRTKTAIGSTRTSFSASKKEPLPVTLKLINPDGKEALKELEFAYLLPENLIASGQVVDFDDFMKQAALMDDRQKINKLQGKCLRTAGSVTRGGRNIKYYAFMVPSRLTWQQLSDKNELNVKSTLDNGNQHLYRGGIYISTRGMPTGIEMTPPMTGQSGYWPNMYMLIEDDSLTFDLGRKSIPGRTQGLLKEIAKERFNEMTKLVNYLTSDPPVTQTINSVLLLQKNQMFDELNKLPNLNLPGFAFQKQPDSQEAAVAAIFHEMLGRGMLKGYTVFKVGYKMSYDLWGQYKPQEEYIGSNHKAASGKTLPLTLEFKYKGESILDDLENNKHFNDIDLLVCWDLDESKFAKERVSVIPLRNEDRFYHGSNYMLQWPGAHNLGAAGIKHVIALRGFIEETIKK